MRKERSQRREQLGKVKLELNQANQSGQLVIEAQSISYSYQQESDHGSNNIHIIIDNFLLGIMRGDRISLLSPNGVGKTSLLIILLAKLSPQ